MFEFEIGLGQRYLIKSVINVQNSNGKLLLQSLLNDISQVCISVVYKIQQAGKHLLLMYLGKLMKSGLLHMPGTPAALI